MPMLFLIIVVAWLEYDDVAETAIRNKTVQNTARGDFKIHIPIIKKPASSQSNISQPEVQYMRPHHELISHAVDLRWLSFASAFRKTWKVNLHYETIAAGHSTFSPLFQVHRLPILQDRAPPPPASRYVSTLLQPLNYRHIPVLQERTPPLTPPLYINFIAFRVH
jgi:hypothetical protein